MRVTRYMKGKAGVGLPDREVVDGAEFVAYWADHKYVSALDSEGTEWLLAAPCALLALAADAALLRISRSTLLRRDCITQVTSELAQRSNDRRLVFIVGERKFVASRRYSRIKSPTYMVPGVYANGERVVAQ